MHAPVHAGLDTGANLDGNHDTVYPIYPIQCGTSQRRFGCGPSWPRCPNWYEVGL